MQQSNRTWVLIGGAVALAVLIGLVWFFTRPSSPAPVYAETGQLVTGFPAELVLDNPAYVDNSYSINYSLKADQLTAQWSSSSSIGSVFGDYANYFQNSGWDVSVPPITDSSAMSISAATTSAYALVNIISQTGGSQVTVTYVRQ